MLHLSPAGSLRWLVLLELSATPWPRTTSPHWDSTRAASLDGRCAGSECCPENNSWRKLLQPGGRRSRPAKDSGWHIGPGHRCEPARDIVNARLPVGRIFVNLSSGYFRVVDIPRGSYTLRAVQYQADPPQWLAAEEPVMVSCSRNIRAPTCAI
jgi:hypothetical protein